MISRFAYNGLLHQVSPHKKVNDLLPRGGKTTQISNSGLSMNGPASTQMNVAQTLKLPMVR